MTKAPVSPGPGLAELVAVALLVVAIRAAFALYARRTFEDALITLRYAENLAAGRGLVFNPGQQVFGASNPLWVLLLGTLGRLGVSPLIGAAKGIGAAADGVTAALGYALLCRGPARRWGGALFVVLFGLAPYVVEVSVSGMETPLVLLFATGAAAAAEANRPYLAGLLLGLLGLTRLDGLLFGAVLLGVQSARRRRLPWRSALVAAGLMAPWLLFAWAYYGSPIPNSIPAKYAAYNLHAPSMLPTAYRLLRRFTPYQAAPDYQLWHGTALLLAAVGALAAWWPRQRQDDGAIAAPVMALYPVAHLAYLTLPRTWVFPWYLPPAFLGYYFTAALGFGTLVGARRDNRVVRAVAALLLLKLATHGAAMLVSAAEDSRQQQRFHSALPQQVGLWLRHQTPPDAVVMLEPIGYIGYYSGRTILDEVGLVSPEMIPFTRQGDGWFGRAVRHFRPDYVVERRDYLAENRTITSEVKLFATTEDRRWFQAQYASVQEFESQLADVPSTFRRFTVFRRRDPREDPDRER